VRWRPLWGSQYLILAALRPVRFALPESSTSVKLAEVYSLDLHSLCPGLKTSSARRTGNTQSVQYIPLRVFEKERLTEAEAREVRRFLALIRGKLRSNRRVT
jgi:hypothetical protein